MRDGQRTTTSEDRATQLLICEALSLAIETPGPPPVQLLLLDPSCNRLAGCLASFPSMSPHLSGCHNFVIIAIDIDTKSA